MDKILYQSTRGGASNKTFEEVLLEGLAPDGGLYIPQTLPHRPPAFWNTLKNKSYIDTAKAIIMPFIGDCMREEDLDRLLKDSYAHGEKSFRNSDITPLKKLDDNFYILELFHGPTLAFKDIALQLLGRLFDHVLNKNNTTMTIVGATSGDTGSAAIEAVRHCERARIFMLHPHGRTSEIQRKQMTHIQADNVFNIAVEGSFDDCQTIVKDLFGDADFRNKQKLSAVNSINWARIIAQTVYYAYAAVRLGAPEKSVRFAVPTGNFGNIYAAYLCKKMGLPIESLIIGSNRNDILTRFFETGDMALENVEPSYSPSMDIQISSNFERFLFDAFDSDPDALNGFMTEFKTTGKATAPEHVMDHAHKFFSAYRCSDADTLDCMADIYKKYNYICDPHTAVGISAAFQHSIEGNYPNIALACAHPAKFPDTVEKALGRKPDQPEILDDALKSDEKYVVLPANSGTIKSFINNQI